MSNLNTAPQDNQSAAVVRRKKTHPDSNAEVVALSPRTLFATNQYVCEICNKAFQRDQNLQLHKRAHNLPARLERRETAAAQAPKKVYICPETSCVHHNPARALGDLTGIRKHYRRKHCEKRWNCTKCSKKYAVESDWKAHSKKCGTKEYYCGCGSRFVRKDIYNAHKVFCVVQEASSSTPIANGSQHHPITARRPQIKQEPQELQFPPITAHLQQASSSSYSGVLQNFSRNRDHSNLQPTLFPFRPPSLPFPAAGQSGTMPMGNYNRMVSNVFGLNISSPYCENRRASLELDMLSRMENNNGFGGGISGGDSGGGGGADGTGEDMVTRDFLGSM
ncbi:protein indeterminate-domain 7-like [Andrographis paniculata]|uniref:protein indeterminate-domain 7-like n=1 Tax=Andrographis paniculata TaxID=175694 RepID=UPI0021E90618|nr:protein indeterminate-domain 7-like [Andrographis paniculata]